MYIQRNIDVELEKWRLLSSRKPLMLRGARQVGKSSSVRNLGKKFNYFIEVNFDENPTYKTVFEQGLSLKEIVEQLSVLSNTPIKEGESLLFLDEIQSCEAAISSLRYFYEKMPNLHVVAAGSLLEFALVEIPSFGVGRVRSMFMYPFSFDEFLLAHKENALLNALVQANEKSEFSALFHQKLKSYLKKTNPLYFKRKENALSYASSLGTQRMVDVHLDIEKFKENKEDSMFVQFSKIGKRFGFPFAEFIQAWTGDLCFIEGGVQKVKERYIETVLDEDFNEEEVTREKEVLIPTYSAMISMNEYGQLFLNKLMRKGILRKEGEDFRFLFSPILKLKKMGDIYQFYSGSSAPKLVPSTNNHVTWTNKGTKYFFSIDSLTRNEVFGSLQIPV